MHQAIELSITSHFSTMPCLSSNMLNLNWYPPTICLRGKKCLTANKSLFEIVVFLIVRVSTLLSYFHVLISECLVNQEIDYVLTH